ncbi:MAG: hypothetical protein HGA72_08375 [Chlorobiaceae bacterium]|nr:hypothetical protein [Chlorobiaceae bacterium]
MISDFFIAVFLAAIFSTPAAPTHHRFLFWFKERRRLSPAMTMLTLWFMVFLPFMVVLCVVAKQVF